MKPLLACLLCLSLPAMGATATDQARAAAAGARAHVNELRGKQMDARKELNELAGRIEALKAERKGKILPGGELDASRCRPPSRRRRPTTSRS